LEFFMARAGSQKGASVSKPKDWSWEEMLEAFHSLGGVASNVSWGTGQHGHGLFAVDPNVPVHVKTPENLLIPVEAVRLDSGRLVIDPSFDISADVCDFFARYQEVFSWGAEGRDSVSEFEKGLAAARPEVMNFLQRSFGMQLESRHTGKDWDAIVLARFLQTRQIGYEDSRKVLMPVVELVNHSAEVPGFKVGQGISVEGVFEGEVLVSYSRSDALRRYLAYGFSYREPFAFSVNIAMPLGGGRSIRVRGQINEGEKASLGLIPKIQEREQALLVSHVMLGSLNNPRIPKTIFVNATQSYLPAQADEVFERLRAANLDRLCALLELLDEPKSNFEIGLRRACLFHLRALSSCFGRREV
jgi:hypothetical protein